MKYLLLSFIISSVFCHKCIHEQIMKQTVVGLAKIKTHERLPEFYGEKTSLKIFLDYSNLKIEGWQKEMIKDNLMPMASQILSDRLKVNKRTGNIRLPEEATTCGGEIQVPGEYISTGFDGDIIMFVTSVNKPDESFLAYAGACFLDPQNGNRPIAGRVVWNEAYLSQERDKYRNQISTAVHEMTHVLVFSPGLYPYFIDQNGQQRGEENVIGEEMIRGIKTNLIKTPRAIEEGKKFWKCDNLPGVQLENQGGSGSLGAHWERTVLHNEMMTASDIREGAFSQFTLALYEDCGWYYPDFNKAEYFLFGAYEGCEFVSDACYAKTKEFKEFCYTQRKGCTYESHAVGVCRADPFSDKCGYIHAYSNGHCARASDGQVSEAYGNFYGPNSKCVETDNLLKEGYTYSGNENTANCFSFKCNGDIAQITVGDQQVDCSVKGEQKTVPGFTGTIICPDPKLFCFQFYGNCPNECSGRGYCNNDKCECKIGYTGADCSGNGIDSGFIQGAAKKAEEFNVNQKIDQISNKVDQINIPKKVEEFNVNSKIDQVSQKVNDINISQKINQIHIDEKFKEIQNDKKVKHLQLEKKFNQIHKTVEQLHVGEKVDQLHVGEKIESIQVQQKVESLEIPEKVEYIWESIKSNINV